MGRTTSSSASATTKHELGIIDRQFALPELAAGPGGAVVCGNDDLERKVVDQNNPKSANDD